MSTKIVNPLKKVARCYYIEFRLALVAYVVVITGSRLLLEGPFRYASTGVQLPIALLPVIPVIVMFAAIVRFLLHSDELSRRIHTDSLAIAGGATALSAVTYGLIEGGPLPHLSAWWTYATFMSAWIAAGFFVRRRYQ